MNKKVVIITILAVVIALLAGFFVFGKKASAPQTQTNKSGSSSITNTSNSPKSNDSTSDSAKTYSKDDVAKHSSESDCWTIIDSSVYNLTSFISQHPGGSEILKACGVDATALFNGSDPNGRAGGHSAVAEEKLAELKVGTLKN